MHIKISVIYNFEIINYSWLFFSSQTFSSVVGVLWIIIIYGVKLCGTSYSLFIAASNFYNRIIAW